ncbi:P-loop containing nucleoside triphosphate hydrolase protein [Coemansia reversa NRRL 1564]|uniref:P-loop containing nucleoside triphosphate hydrolase protein n=1 Tax=Coemansia reversa (strain ATCC 12441 / NRRL 1564) TaxID=763665 RepID=A0A2G5BIH3_COERN|nr:P-loop containing nucleoside triphosphate hydrolase protein [Coemansia reversa NRRL 1564]|eukprot:PIA18806.1 P-loop containing nucleoside triphosphate hydrolase protein [Coemansia reversa NRRL 1564]
MRLSNSSSPTPTNVEPVLSWNNLNYDIKVKGGTRRVLHNAGGSVYPGEIVAIMGASCAGKTTLLNILSGRIQGGKLEGSIQFQGAPRNPHNFKRMLGFVEQDDLMHPTLTVEETLLVSA